MIYVNTEQAIKEITKQFKNQLSKPQINKAIARAINHTIAKSKTAVSKEIRKVYKVKASDIKRDIAIIKATVMRQQGIVNAKGKGLPLKAFGARQTRKGVSVNITGKRKVVQSSFLATMPSGHEGVFARGKYSRGDFQFRKKRLAKKGPDLPIAQLFTAAVPTMMMNNTVISIVSRQMQADLPSRLMHELNRMAQPSTPTS